MEVWKYFFLTIAIELPVIVVSLRPEWKNALRIGLLLNLFTWPLLVAIYNLTGWNIFLLECGVAITEGCGYRIFFYRSWMCCMGISFLVNGLSFGAGLIFFQ